MLKVEYHRIYLLNEKEKFRLTIDNNILCEGLHRVPIRRVMLNYGVLEIKFDAQRPVEEILSIMKMQINRSSKYCDGIIKVTNGHS